MINKFLILGFAALVFGMFSLVTPVEAKSLAKSAAATVVKSKKVRSYRFGPYATLRRANEVANYARNLGYNAKVIYGGSIIYGTREYYVDVW
jgi:hypothetical protein